MTRTRRFLGGLTVGYASQAVMTLVGFWLVQFLLEMLGQRTYGLWLVAGQLLGYLALLDLGVVALLPRQTAWATGRAARPDTGDDPEDLPAVFGQTMRLTLWQTPLVGLVSAGLWLLLPDQWSSLEGPLGIVLIAFTVTFPLRAFEASLKGLQDLRWVGLASFACWGANMVTLIVLVLAGYGLYGLAAGWVVGRVGRGVASWVRLRRQFPEALPRGLPPVRHAARIFGRSLWISVEQVAHVLLSATDLVLIGLLLGPAATVPYAVTVKLITALSHYPQALVETAVPGVSEVRTGESRDRLRQVTRALAEAILLFSGLLICIVLAVNEGFVIWWVGIEQWGGLTLTLLILARVLVGHWVTSLQLTLFAVGYERRIALTALATGVVTVAASLVLIPAVGVAGAPAATLLGFLLVRAPAHLAAMSRETGATVGATLGTLWPWAWRFTVAALVAGIAIAPRVGPSVVELALGTLAAAGTYGLLLVPRLAARPLRIYLHPRIVAVAERFALPARPPA